MAKDGDAMNGRQPKTCDNCGRELDAGQWLYSTYTRRRYCLENTHACDKLADRRKKREAA